MEDSVASVEDLLRGSNNPNPEMVVAEYAKILQHYGVSVVYSDNHAKGWVTENWSKHGGIEKRPSFGPKTEIYAELLPWLEFTWKIQILDHPKRAAQLIALERTISRTGHETISHPPNAHDDLINATAGALMTAARNATLEAADSDNRAVCCFQRPAQFSMRNLFNDQSGGNCEAAHMGTTHCKRPRDKAEIYGN